MQPKSVVNPDWATAHVLLGLALVTAACLIAGRLLNRWNQPPVIAEILVGLTLGPAALGYLPGDLPQKLFPSETRPYLAVLANVGLVLFMFVVGFEVDLGAIRRMRGRAASVATTSVLVPFGIGLGIAWVIDAAPGSTSGPPASRLLQSLFIGVAFSATAFPVLARILDETALKQLPIRTLALSAAAAGDIASWTMLAVVVALARRTGAGATLLLLAEFGALILALRYVARPLLIRLLRGGLPRGGTGSALGLVLVGIFISSWTTTMMHIHPIFGAFAFGFACPREVICRVVPDLGVKLTDASRILMPMFFVLTGLSMSLRGFGPREFAITAVVTVGASVGKVLGVYLIGRLYRMSGKDSLGLGLLMNTRGLTELVILNVGRTSGVLSARMFTVMAVMAIVTTLITGPLMGRLYSGLTICSTNPRSRFVKPRRSLLPRRRSRQLVGPKASLPSRMKEPPEAAAAVRDIRYVLASGQRPALERPPER